MNQPDPQKAIYLQPNQQRVPGEQHSPKPAAAQWETHQGDQALDAWGVAVRTLREQGHDFSSPAP